MNRRRQHFNWFRIIFLILLIAGGLYVDQFVIPASAPIFEPTATATRPAEAYITEGQTLKVNHALVIANARLAAQVATALARP